MEWPSLSRFPIQAKALVTAMVMILSIAMLGALGQIIVHDIIPTFFSSQTSGMHQGYETADDQSTSSKALADDRPDRGDLFSDIPQETASPIPKPIYETDQFVWLLKWTHIHLFGMNMIFIFVGAIAIFLCVDTRVRTWLVILPFFGVVTDIAAMWLKTYASPHFFWLHIPGGGLFVAVFFYVSLRALWEMWIRPEECHM
jgi:hypothetical protein